MIRRNPFAVGAGLAAAFCLSAPSHAEVLDRVGVYVDGWHASVDGSGRIDGSVAGTRYDLVEDTAIDDRATGYEVGAWFHPKGRHRLRVAASWLSADGSGELPRPLVLGGVSVPAGTSVASSLDVHVYEAHYAWSFVNMEIVNVAIVAGLDRLDADNTVRVPGASPVAHPAATIPAIGLTAQVQPVVFLRVYGEAIYATSASGPDARARDLRVRAEFYVTHLFGLGIGYRDLEVRVDDPGEGLVDAHSGGFQAYLLFRL